MASHMGCQGLAGCQAQSTVLNGGVLIGRESGPPLSPGSSVTSPSEHTHTHTHICHQNTSLKLSLPVVLLSSLPLLASERYH